MTMDTVATLGLMGQMMESFVSVNTASGRNMGISGDIYLTFKIGKNILLHRGLCYVTVSADLSF